MLDTGEHVAPKSIQTAEIVGSRRRSKPASSPPSGRNSELLDEVKLQPTTAAAVAFRCDRRRPSIAALSFLRANSPRPSHSLVKDASVVVKSLKTEGRGVS